MSLVKLWFSDRVEADRISIYAEGVQFLILSAKEIKFLQKLKYAVGSQENDFFVRVKIEVVNNDALKALIESKTIKIQSPNIYSSIKDQEWYAVEKSKLPTKEDVDVISKFLKTDVMNMTGDIQTKVDELFERKPHLLTREIAQKMMDIFKQGYHIPKVNVLCEIIKRFPEFIDDVDQRDMYHILYALSEGGYLKERRGKYILKKLQKK